jgi:hypothetical protein
MHLWPCSEPRVQGGGLDQTVEQTAHTNPMSLASSAASAREETLSLR